jgi:hypothetical protein
MRISCLEKSFWNNLVNVSPIVAAPLFSVMQNNHKKKNSQNFPSPRARRNGNTRRSATQCTKQNPSAKHRNTQHKKTANAPAEEEKKKKKKQIQIPIEMRTHLRGSCHVVCLFSDCFRPVLGGY